MGIVSRTPIERVGDKRPEMLQEMHDQNSITHQPSWLWMFNPDQPERKAAFCAFWRDLMYPDEMLLMSRVIAGDDLSSRDAKILERVFARMLMHCVGVDWSEHPNCQREYLGGSNEAH